MNDNWRIYLVKNLKNRIEIRCKYGNHHYGGGNDYVYAIGRYRFGETIGDNISDWIYRISRKSWSDIDSLYEVGSIMSQDARTNHIDWELTFYYVEREIFMKNQFRELWTLYETMLENIKDVVTNETKPSTIDKLMFEIEMRARLTNEETDNYLWNLVDSKLKAFNFRLNKTHQ